MTFRDSAARVGLSTTQALVRSLPLAPAVDFGRTLGRSVALFFPRERRIASSQLQVVRSRKPLGPAVETDPALALHESVFRARQLSAETNSSELVRSVFGHAFESAVEAFRLPELLTQDESGSFKRIDFTGQEHVAEIMREGRGAIALSGHIGCFELLAAFHVRWGAKVTVIGRDPNYSSVSKLIRDLRHSYGVETIWRDEAATPKLWLSALQQGRVVAVLIDQDVALDNAFTSFFGLPAAYPITPIRMAIRRKIPIISSFIVRTAKLQHHVITAPLQYDPDDPQAADHVLRTFNGRLEDLICRFPEQWIWWHRRWRRRPQIDYTKEPERLRSTEDYLAWLANGADNGE
ncbi:MAG: lysophospholipid acyltransferase family protein [Bdellovibrionota bacterium]